MKKKTYKITEEQLRFLISAKSDELKKWDSSLSVPVFMRNELIKEIQELRNLLT